MALSAKKLSWYRHRLAAMSKAEIAHRIGEQLKRRYDRRKTAPQRSYDRGIIPGIPGLRAAIKNWEIPRALLAEWQEGAKQAQAGRFFLLGQAWPPCSDARKWHIDPVSGQSWPDQTYCFDIDFRHAATRGDIKYVWELNRLQYLQPIAALACKNADRTLAKFCIDEIISWIDANPPHCGVHWASGIELALRTVSILVVTSCVGEYLDTPSRIKIWNTLEAHGQWLERYPSLYSSANNHLVAEGLGLFMLGALLETLPDAARWRVRGWDILCQAAQEQILPDGVGAEQTITYTAVVLEMLLLGMHIARAVNIQVSGIYTDRVTKGGIYLRWFTDGAGNHPFIGDNDNARVLGVYHRDENYVRSILSSIAAVTQRADLTPPQAEPHLRQAIFGLPPTPDFDCYGVKNFFEGGYTVGRHKTAKHEAMVAFDHGQLGYLAIAAHGHADALALWLHLDGHPILVDAGTYLYHSGGVWRDYFRSTAAHNTLCLENTSSSIMAGHFNWAHKAEAGITSFERHAESWEIEAQHDGYLKKFGVLHNRHLRVDHATGLTVTDRLLRRGGKHNVQIGFMLHPDLRAQQQGNIVTIKRHGTIILRAVYDGPLTCQVAAPDTPEGGWYSDSFGCKTPTTRIVCSGTLAVNTPSTMRFLYDTAPDGTDT